MEGSRRRVRVRFAVTYAWPALSRRSLLVSLSLLYIRELFPIMIIKSLIRPFRKLRRPTYLGNKELLRNV